MLVAMKQVKKCLEASSPTLQPFICKENIRTVSGTKLLGLLNHTLSKSYYLIHKLFPTNLLSFQEPVNFGTPYLTLPLNTITYLPSNLTSTNWISSPYLINCHFSFFLCQGFAIGSIGLSLTSLIKKGGF